MKRTAIALAAAAATLTAAASASALPTKLDRIWGGTKGTTVFIHGKANCTNSAGSHYQKRCGEDPTGYWLNSTDDGGDGHDFMDEATAKNTSSGWEFAEAFAVRADIESQGYWGATNDVANCLLDLARGTNDTGCNPSLYKRTSFRVVGHSAGGTIIDRIFSTGWWPELTTAISGSPRVSAGALAGSKASSALYGVDGASNFCTDLVSWAVGWAFKNPAAASLTRGSVIGEARNGMAGKSPRWIYKITTRGGGCSANNNGAWYMTCRDTIKEHVNDSKMGTLVGCIGYSSDDDTDGVLWSYDSDPTASPSTSNGGKYRAEYTGNYWHYFKSWANHSHTRNDAYVAKYGYQTTSGCYLISPGTCIGQYSW